MAQPLADRIAEIKAKKEKLTAKLNRLSAKARLEEDQRQTRRKIVVGGAILAALENEPQMRPSVRKVLQRYITREQDQQVIADLLGLTSAPPVKPRGVDPRQNSAE